MSATLPQPLAGSQAPSSFELLWERNRRTVQGLFWLLAAGVLAYYGLKYYSQKQVDAKWSKFASASLLHSTYSPTRVDPSLASSYEAVAALLDDVHSAPAGKLEQALAEATPEQAPYLLWLQANRAMAAGDFQALDQVAQRLTQDYAQHPLVAKSSFPVQVREPVKRTPEEKAKEKADPKAANKEPELVAAKEGSSIALLQAQAAAARDYQAPATFAMPAIPADSPRYRVSLQGGRSFVLALMTGAAPKHCAKFEELANSNYWVGTKVDEITRPGKMRWGSRSVRLHFGFESTKTEDNRSDWDTTSASPEDRVVNEVSPLSHFPGAVAARNRDGKSEMDRLYVCASDCAVEDDSRQVFAYVVDGIEVVREVCESDFARSEDQDRGTGLPAENFVVESVTKL